MFDVEVVVRASGQVTQETLYHDGNEPPAWTEQDVRAVLTLMLVAIERAATGRAEEGRAVALRGLSWIVTPFDGGSAIAIEIPTGSVVAGPFEVPEPTLNGLIAAAIARDTPARPS